MAPCHIRAWIRIQVPGGHLSALTLTLRLSPPEPFALQALAFELEIHNPGPQGVELPEIHGFDLDLPQEVSHSSDSQGELWIRRVGHPEPGERRYSCTDVEFEELSWVLEPGLSLRHSLGASELSPGDYEARVRLYRPEASSNLLRFAV